MILLPVAVKKTEMDSSITEERNPRLRDPSTPNPAKGSYRPVEWERRCFRPDKGSEEGGDGNAGLESTVWRPLLLF